jgi:outer membrane protein assembly factor BamB
LNATSGALVWSFNPTSTYDDSIESNLVIANGVVYAEGEYGDAEAGVLEMLTAATGTLVGRVLNNDIGYFEGSPVVVNGIVYCLSDVGSLNTYHLSGATSKKSA